MWPGARSAWPRSHAAFPSASTATGAPHKAMTYFFQAFRPLLVDFLSTIVFVALYAITGSIRTAIVLGIAVGIGQIALILWRGKRPDLMQWASLALVIVLGSASLITHDPRFVMIKPSIGGFAIGIVMLKPNWQGR